MKKVSLTEGVFKAVSITVFTLLIASCGRIPNSVAPDEKTGTLELRTCIFKNGLAKEMIAAGVGLCDSLIIEISGPGMPEFRYGKSFDLSNPVSTQTVQGVPTGTDRTVKVFTVDKTGDIIHIDSIDHKGVRIDAQNVTSLTVMLIPAVGSMYLQLENIPTRVDSVFAMFAPGVGQPWIARAKRSSKIFLSLQKIPHNTHGLLTVAAVDSTKDTLYAASNEITFNACSMESIVLNFTSAPGQLSFDMAVVMPGITNVSGSISTPDTQPAETGELLITEIMYAANDSEYIEVYNPGDNDRSYDTIIVDIDGTKRVFTGVAVASKKTFVFGRIMLPWADACHATASALDLSGSGNWITLRGKDGKMMDRVIFTGGSNTQEWPNVSGKRAIVLDNAINDAMLNNFGRNWRGGTELISGTNAQYGTPHMR
jgi:hypothetical protein